MSRLAANTGWQLPRVIAAWIVLSVSACEMPLIPPVTETATQRWTRLERHARLASARRLGCAVALVRTRNLLHDLYLSDGCGQRLLLRYRTVERGFADRFEVLPDDWFTAPHGATRPAGPARPAALPDPRRPATVALIRDARYAASRRMPCLAANILIWPLSATVLRARGCGHHVLMRLNGHGGDPEERFDLLPPDTPESELLAAPPVPPGAPEPAVEDAPVTATPSCPRRDARFPSAAVGGEARLLAADVLACADGQVHLQAVTAGRIVAEGCGLRLVLQRCLPDDAHPAGYFQVLPYSEDVIR